MTKVALITVFPRNCILAWAKGAPPLASRAEVTDPHFVRDYGH